MRRQGKLVLVEHQLHWVQVWVVVAAQAVVSVRRRSCTQATRAHLPQDGSWSTHSIPTSWRVRLAASPVRSPECCVAKMRGSKNPIGVCIRSPGVPTCLALANVAESMLPSDKPVVRMNRTARPLLGLARGMPGARATQATRSTKRSKDHSSMPRHRHRMAHRR